MTIPIGCTVTTANTSGGSTCAVSTTANALYPGIAQALERAIWQLGQLVVFDGGPDGAASTTEDNAIFMRQGLFVP